MTIEEIASLAKDQLLEILVDKRYSEYDFSEMLALANRTRRLGLYEDAISIYKLLVDSSDFDRHKKRFRILYFLSLCQYKIGRAKEAESTFLSASDLSVYNNPDEIAFALALFVASSNSLIDTAALRFDTHQLYPIKSQLYALAVWNNDACRAAFCKLCLNQSFPSCSSSDWRLFAEEPSDINEVCLRYWLLMNARGVVPYDKSLVFRQWASRISSHAIAQDCISIFLEEMYKQPEQVILRTIEESEGLDYLFFIHSSLFLSAQQLSISGSARSRLNSQIRMLVAGRVLESMGDLLDIATTPNSQETRYIHIYLPTLRGKSSSLSQAIRALMMAVNAADTSIRFNLLISDELFIPTKHLRPPEMSSVFSSEHEALFGSLPQVDNVEYLRRDDDWEAVCKKILKLYAAKPALATLYFSYNNICIFKELLRRIAPHAYIQTNKDSTPDSLYDCYFGVGSDADVVSSKQRRPGKWYRLKALYEDKCAHMTSQPYMDERLDLLVDLKKKSGMQVVVTVGNRLENELGHDFIESVGRAAEDRSVSFIWLIIGPLSAERLNNDFEGVNERRPCIFHIDYSSNLFHYYRICDVYLNCVRSGGGLSMAWAIYSGVPVVSRADSDAATFMKSEFLSVSVEEMIELLISYISKPGLARSAAKAQRDYLAASCDPSVVGRSFLDDLLGHK